jgi:hypothetical protein
MSDTVRVNIAKRDPGPCKALLAASTEAEKSWAASGTEQVSAVVWAATAINAFNRIAVSSRYHVGP